MPDPEVADPPKPPTVTISASALMDTSRRASDVPLMASIPGHESVIVKVLQPITIISVRAGRVFIQSILGGLATTTGVKAMGAVPALDFFHLLLLAASLSVGTAVVCILQNVLELLTQFDQSHPTLTA